MSRLGKILYLLSGLSLVSFAVVRFLLGAWVPFLWVALGLFVSFIGAAFWVDRSFYKEFLSMKTTKQGMSMGALISLVLVLLIAINFIAVRKYKTFDFSAAKINTLSDQSIKLLNSLDSDLKVLYFYKNGTEGVEQNRRSFIDLIRKYQDQSSNIKLEFVEINERPDLAEEYQIKQGTQVVYLTYKGRKAKIEKIDEQELTGALIKTTREKDKLVYILSGHGELPLDPSKDGQSVSLLKQMLEGARYTVKSLSFLQSSSVPADADILLIVGPTMGLLEPEVKALEDYMKRGGSIILAIEPNTKPGLEGFFKKVGINIKNNYIASVLETQIGKAVDPRFARGSVFSTTHQITKPFGKDQFVIFRLPTAIEKMAPAPAGITIDELVKTNSATMAFTDTKFNKEGQSGPFAVGMAIKGRWPGADEKASEFNLLVFGDADFMNEQYLYQNLNRDLVLNSIAYLSKEENLISITPKEVGVTQMNVTETQFTLFVFGFIIPLPVLLFVTSGVIWYRRRYS